MRKAIPTTVKNKSKSRSKSAEKSGTSKTIKKSKAAQPRTQRLTTTKATSKSKKPIMTDVNDASMLYAKKLNKNPLTPVVQSILDMRSNQDKKKFVAAPYIFIDRDGFDYEDKSTGYGLSPTHYLNTDKGVIYDIEHDTDALSGQIADSVYHIFNMYGLGNKYTRFAGIMGIKIHNADGTEFGDHYVAYVYDSGVFAFFDSGAPTPCQTQKEDNNIYKILIPVMNRVLRAKKTNRHKRLMQICNEGTFETAAGASEDDYNYIGQNIFCHSWSMWFIYQYVVLGKSMTEIDALAGSGRDADLDNLLRIKTFVYKVIMPQANLDYFKKDPRFKLFTSYIHDPEFVSGVEKTGKRRKRVQQRYITAIPELEEFATSHV
jgi:hypothetical protein